MKSHRKPPTKSESARMAKVRQMPCIACRRHGNFLQCGKTEGHHLLSGGRRRGHAFVIPLGRWHHQGIPLNGYSTGAMAEMFGPSLRLNSKQFHAVYGTDDELLEKVNALLGKL